MTTSSVPSVHLRPVRPGNPDRAGAGRRTYWPAIAGVAYLLAWTVGLAVWPANLAVFYPYVRRTLFAPEVLASAAVLVAVTALALWCWRRRPYLPVG